jgi:hypothetical protein
MPPDVQLKAASIPNVIVREFCVEQLCIVMHSHALRTTDAPVTG